MKSNDKAISHRSKFFLRSMERDARKKIKPYIKNFELSCILSSFEESLLVIPFETKEYEIGLKTIYDYIRQLIIARLGEKMLFEAVYKDGKESKNAASVLVQRITDDPTEDGSGGFDQVPEININFKSPDK